MTNVCRTLADIVLTIHVAFVVFVVAGLFFVLIGGVANWSWVRNRRFRLLHLSGIGVVVVQSWAGVRCPLTTLEMWLRGQAGAAVYEGSCIRHWLQEFLYYDAPGWVFGLVYTVFGLTVMLAFILIPPRPRP